MQRGLTTALTQAAIFGSLILTAAVGFGVASYMLLSDEAVASDMPAGSTARSGAAPVTLSAALDVTWLQDAAYMSASAAAPTGEREAVTATWAAAPDPAAAIAGATSELRGSAALAVRSEPSPASEDTALIVAAETPRPALEQPIAPPSVIPLSIARPGVIGAPGPGVTPELSPGDRIEATVSFYYCEQSEGDSIPGDGGGFCGAMRDGTIVYPGAAACAYDYLGQLFRIEGDPTERIYRCNDTGNAVLGLHRDIWFHSSDEGWVWAYSVGQRAVIEILP